MKAYILVQTEVGRSADTARTIQDLGGVQNVEQVTGPYDVVVEVEARNLDDLSAGVIARLHEIEGITRTLTCAAPAA